MQSYRHTPLIALVGLVFSLPLANAGQVSATNYVNTFDSSASDFSLVAPASGAWSLNTSGGGFLGHNDTEAVFGVYTASIQHTLLGGAAATAAGFTFSSTVTYTATGVASGNELGVAFLNGSSTLDSVTNGYRVYIRGTQSGGPSVFLVRNGVVVDSTGDFNNELRDFYGDTISFSVTGSYVDNVGSDGINDALSISVSIENQTKSSSFALSYLDTDPLTGNFFGLRDGDQSGSFGFNAQWDSVSLTVAAIPEPSAAAMFTGLSVIGLAALRRRR